jgi:hypothetical protein
MKKLLLLCVAICFIFGCKSGFNTAPILNFADQPVHKGLTMAEMEKCIVIAGAELGWVMTKRSEGLIEGSIQRRGHTAVVSIPYSTKAYSITYKSSSAGLYADENGNIHKTYNTWVNNLARQINAKIVSEAY